MLSPPREPRLLSPPREPRPREPGKAQRIDYEYRREGTGNLFLFFDPHRAWRRIEVTRRRTALDFAHQMKGLVEEGYPQAEILRVVLDQLNTHTPASLYEAFPPEEARQIIQRLAFHYPPKHASWLTRAEIEFSLLERQRLDRRLASLQEVRRKTGAWTEARNQAGAPVQWRFTTEKARTKMHRLSLIHI